PRDAAESALVVHVVAVASRIGGERRVGVAPSLGGVQFRLATRPPLGGGKGVFDPGFGAVTDGESSPAGRLIADGETGLPADQIAAGFGDYIDRAVERAASVNGGSGAADQLDAVHHFEIENEIGSDRSGLVDRVVHPVPVDEEKGA